MKRSLIPEAIVHDEGDLEITMGDVAVRMPIEDWLTSALLPKTLAGAGGSLFTILQAKQQRDNDWSIGEIADYHGVSRRTIHRWFRRIGLPASIDSRVRDYGPLRSKAVELAGKGYKRKEIAAALGVHRDTISDWTRRMAL